ncbi:hypothetical protein JOC94_001615 [Bacillus thermophilus]|uniref:Uncharacterized protein n=1 Tax=Siminovitchia thermophila TaxID=1245522 RepID=A0ABS2R6X7_9BACI|nr:hypothetical protein [Siminovitchia thermophila]
MEWFFNIETYAYLSFGETSATLKLESSYMISNLSIECAKDANGFFSSVVFLMSLIGIFFNRSLLNGSLCILYPVDMNRVAKGMVNKSVSRSFPMKSGLKQAMIQPQ